MAFLVVARLRNVWRAWLPTVLALALTLATPIAAAALASATSTAALRQGLSALQVSERTVVVSYNGIIDETEYRRLDALVTAALPRLTTPPVRRQMLYRQIAGTDGEAFVLAGTDGVAGAVRLVSGRLPTSCTPRRCEVVALVGAGASTTASPTDAPAASPSAELGLMIVGTAQRNDPLLLGGTFDPGPGIPILLGEGVSRVSALEALSLFGRSSGWVAPADADRVAVQGVEDWIREADLVAQELWRDGEGLVLTSAQEVVRDQQRRATASAQRFGVLAASMAVLALGSAVVGGAAIRSDHEALLSALRRRGATGRQRRTLTAAEVAAVALAALLGAVLLGSALAWLVAVRASIPLWPTVFRSLAGAAPAVLAATAIAAVVLAGALRGRLSRTALAAAAASCAVGAALVISRGGVTASATGDSLLTALPILVLAGAGLATAALWPALASRIGTVLPRRAAAARLGAGAVAGRAVRPSATAALLAMGLAAFSFAIGYRATLDQGAADQAAFAVPAQVVLARSSTGPRPGDVTDGAALRSRLGPDVVVDPVVRAVGSVRGADGVGAPVQLFGLPPQALTRVPRWAQVTGDDLTATAAATSITVDPSRLPAGLALPDGATLRIEAVTPLRVVLIAYFRSSAGQERTVDLVWDSSTVQAAVRASLPPGGQWWLTAITVRQPTDSADFRQHNLGEGTKGRDVPSGRLALQRLSVDDTVVTRPWQGWTVAAPDNGEVAPGSTADSLLLDVRLDTGLLPLTARGAGPGSTPADPLPVLLDPASAADAAAGRLTLTLDGGALPVRVAGVLDRFPTTSGRFAVADGEALARVVGLRAPGTGQALQLWLNQVPAERLDGPEGEPFDRVSVQRRDQVEASLRADPVARAASGLLIAAAVLVLGIAALALLALVVAERREDAARLYAWEADGLSPSRVRTALWWRAVAVVLPAVPIGAVAGAVLAVLTARLVAVTAAATQARPPLVSGLGLGTATVASASVLAGLLVVAALICAGTAREPLPRRDWGR